MWSDRNMPEKRTYVISDSHIGHNANYPKINKFLEKVQTDADVLILNGDIYDLTRCPFKKIISEEPTKETHELLIETLDIVPEHVFVRGNHDFSIDKYLDVNCVDTYIQDNIFFFHGWQLDVQMWLGLPFFSWFITPYVYQKIMKPTYKIYKGEFPLDEYAAKIHARAEVFADKTGFKRICIGHTHNCLISEKVLDSGDGIDSTSYILLEDEHPRLMRM